MVSSATSFNDQILFTTFTPAVLAAMQNQVGRWATPPANLLISYDIWQDIIATHEFANYFDQVTKHELILEGRLGSIFGMQIITDGFRYESLQVLQPGEVFMTSSPVTLGTITQVKELDSRAIDFYNQGVSARGWFNA